MRKKITLQNFVSLSLILFFTISSFGQVVTSNADDGSAGTLRSQIAAAAPGSTITVDVSVTNITLTLGQITVNKSLTLTGNGSSTTIIDGAANGRIFDITAGSFTLNAIRLTNGLADNGGAIQVVGASLAINNSVISNSIANGTLGSGGAVLVGTGSTLTTSNASFTGNRSNRAGGAVEAVAGTTVSFTNSNFTTNNTGVAPATANPGNGGAFHMTGNGTVNVTGGMFFNNMAAAEGGALWNGSGTMTISGTTINANTASGVAADNGGGGIYNLNGGTLNINGATITNNMANGTMGSGGGILNDVGSTLNINNSTINNNTANRAGGGIEGNATAGASFITLTDVSLNNNTVFTSPGNGGGLHMTGPGTVTVNFGTVNGNTAGSEGGGLWNGTGTMTVNGTTINANTALGAAADNGGGGIYQNNGGTLIVQNNAVISNNIASGTAGSGGGILSDIGAMVTVTNSTITGNRSNRAGGGIEAVAGTTTTLNNVTLTNNNTGVAPAVAAPGNGGGFHITGNGNAAVNGGIVNNNLAGNQGAGLWNGSGTMSVTGTTINGNVVSGNAATSGGGGLYNQVGTLNLTNATVTNNMVSGTLGIGGGILNNGAMLSISGGSLSTNTSNLNGGGIFTNNGATTIGSNASITNNIALGATAPTDGGGGIYIANTATVAVTGGTFSGNKAITGGGSGGAVFNFSGTFTANGTAITSNISNRAGGGIEAAAGSTTNLTNVTLNSNVTGVVASGSGAASPGNGGGLHLTGAAVGNVTGGTANLNLAGNQGGGLWNGAATLTVDGTTINGNIVSGNGAASGGGGLYNQVGTLNVTNSTVSNNVANGMMGIGGGILNNGAAVNLSSTTVSNNSANLNGGGLFTNMGTTTIQTNSALTNNTSLGATAPTNGGGGIYISAGTVTMNGGSLTGNTAITGGGSGGGVFNFAGTFNASGTAITANIANRAGGGIEAAAGSTTNLTTVSLNTNVAGVVANGATVASPGNGGGLHITGAGNATILGGTANGNSAALEGGGLWNGSGLMTVTNTTVNGNSAQGAAADDGGAGLFNNAGTLTIDNAMITNNNATGTSGSGGGLLSLVGAVTITNSTFDNNSANRAGGAIEVVNGALNMTNSNMINNDVDGTAGTPNPGNGGALHITGVTTTMITGGTVSGNDARREGGGLWNQTGSTMTVSNVNINANTARGNGATFGGGGIFVNGGNVIVNSSSITNNTSTGAAGNGGGVHVKTGSAALTTTTVSGNTSAANGGGIFSNAALNINASTIANNTAVTGGGVANTSASLPVVKNTIVASNIAATDADVSSTTGAFVSNGFNLIGQGSATSFVAASGDIVGTNATPAIAFLNALANNGGTTLTQSLQSNSPAYNGGDLADSFTDQLGNAIFGGRRDIGAFESQVAGLVYTGLQTATCGATLNALTVTINANVTTAAQAYRFRITKVDSMTNVALAPATIVDRPVNNVALSNVAGITYNSRYQVEVAIRVNNVWQAYGASCFVNTPNPIATIGAQCGTTLTALNQFINATVVPNVTNYRFRVTQLDANLLPVGTPQVTTQSLNKFNMTQLSGILYATTYSVEVALRNTDGTYLNYGTACNITTPNYPLTQLVANQCSYTVPNATTFIYADIVSGATQYRFRIFNGVGFDATYTNTSTNRFTLNNFPGITSGSYSVQVAVRIPSQPDFGPYGAICTITNGGMMVKEMDSKIDNTTSVSNGFEVVAYPNPYSASFKLDIKTVSSETIQVRVYDMLGKMVENQTINVAESAAFEMGSNHNAGVYNVMVSQGETTRTFRMIKR